MIRDLLLGLAGGLLVSWAALVVVLWRGAPRVDADLLRDCVRLVPDVARLLRRMIADRTIPLRVRLALGALLAYLLNPVDLVPDVIPVIGYADDVVVVAWTLRSVVRRAGAEALSRHWPGSPEGLALVRRLAALPPADAPPG